MLNKPDSDVFDAIPIDDEYDGFFVFVVGKPVRETIRGNNPKTLSLIAVPHKSIDDPVSILSERMETDGNSSIKFIDSNGYNVRLPRRWKANEEDFYGYEMGVVEPGTDVEDAIEYELELQTVTNNAVAYDIRNGDFIDPFDGMKDTYAGVIRHIDLDGERDNWILDVAQTASETGFDVDQLAIDRAVDKETINIPPKRAGRHIISAFESAEYPRLFFDVLKYMDVLDDVYPFINNLIGVPAGPVGTHEEGDSYEHTMMVLESMFDIRGNDVPALLAALGHDVGKGETPDDILPSHYGHGNRGANMIDSIGRTFGFGKDNRRVMKAAARFHMRLHSITEMGEAKIMKMVVDVERMSAPFDIDLLLDIGEADTNGRKTPDDVPNEYHREDIREKLVAAQEVYYSCDADYSMNKRNITASEIGDGKKYEGHQIKNIIRQDRVEKMRQLIQSN